MRNWQGRLETQFWMSILQLQEDLHWIQASYIIALKFGLYRDKERLIRQFQERLKKDAYKMQCGFVGAPLLWHDTWKIKWKSWLMILFSRSSNCSIV